MFKNHFFLSFISLFLCFNLSAIPKEQFEAKPNTIILWDIHDVLLKRDKRKIFEILWNYENKWQLMKHCSPKVLLNVFDLIRRKIFSSLDDSITYLIDSSKEKNPFLIDLTLRIGNAYRPIKGTIKIVQDLHDWGYKQHIGSNINPYVFENLTDAKHQPVLSPYFTFFDTTKSQLPFNDKQGKYIEKPNAQFFLEYMQRNNIDPDTVNILFIDDRKENIDTANSVGIQAIHFKSPEQLRADLINKGILPETSAFEIERRNTIA